MVFNVFNYYTCSFPEPNTLGQIGNFLSELGKKYTFWLWEWGRISAPNFGDREPCAVYLLLVALPLEAELHKRQLSLLHNILVSTNETVRDLTERRTEINLANKLSYYSHVRDIL